MLFAKISAAVHWDCITADQYERETFIEVTACVTWLLSACFAMQPRAVGSTFCQEQCCSALGLHHCRPV